MMILQRQDITFAASTVFITFIFNTLIKTSHSISYYWHKRKREKAKWEKSNCK